MANLWVTEFAATGIPFDSGGTLNTPFAQEPAAAAQKVAFTTATQSAAFGSTTKIVRLVADANCHVLFGADPTADADDERLTSGVAEWRVVTAGHKVSVYDGSS